MTTLFGEVWPSGYVRYRYPWISTLDFSARRDGQGRSCHFCGFLKSTIREARSKNTTRSHWSAQKPSPLKVLFFGARKPTLISVRTHSSRAVWFSRLFAQIESTKISTRWKQRSKETVSATHIVLNVGLFWQCRDFYVTPVITTPLANTIQYYIDVTWCQIIAIVSNNDNKDNKGTHRHECSHRDVHTATS